VGDRSRVASSEQVHKAWELGRPSEKLVLFSKILGKTGGGVSARKNARQVSTPLYKQGAKGGCPTTDKESTKVSIVSEEEAKGRVGPTIKLGHP